MQNNIHRKKQKGSLGKHFRWGKYKFKRNYHNPKLMQAVSVKVFIVAIR